MAIAINKIDIAQAAAKLTQPYSTMELAQLSDSVVRLTICQGAVPWHKHMDVDELFLVQKGEILLESEWGDNILGVGDMAVIPKGIRHRSSSIHWSVVLQFLRKYMEDRTDGERRVLAGYEGYQVSKSNVVKEAQLIAELFSPVRIASVDDSLVAVAVYEGEGPWQKYEERDKVLLLWEGEIALEIEDLSVPVRAGELFFIPRGAEHRFVSPARSIAVLFSKKERV